MHAYNKYVPRIVLVCIPGGSGFQGSTVQTIHCKKFEVDLTLKRSSQLQSGFIQVQVVVQLLLQGFSVTPFAIEDV